MLIIAPYAIGMGHDADTVVSSYACLDSQCMRLASAAYLQKKSDVVNRFTMMDIVEVSSSCTSILFCGDISDAILYHQHPQEFYDRYYAETNTKPLRCVHKL